MNLHPGTLNALHIHKVCMVTARMHERIYISAYDIWMRRRKHAAIVRYPTFSVSSDDYYYSLLMLMLPHTQESELLAGFESVG